MPADDAISLAQAAVLGLVEGITEYLPISSTGHLVLTSWILSLDRPPELKHSVDAFCIVIQGGAILAVLGLYRATALRIVRGLLGKDNAGFALLVNLGIAFVPAAVLGLLFDDWIEARLFRAGPVLAALFIGGVFMIALDMRRRGRFGPPKYHALSNKTVYDVTPRQALTVGLLQVFSLWPGTSRSMMTITGGLIAGLPARAAAEFSFLLGVLTLTAATGYTLVKNLVHAHRTGTPSMVDTLGVAPILVGIVVAAASAAVTVKWLVGFLNRRGLAPFGWYRIVLAVVLAALMWNGALTLAPDDTRPISEHREVGASGAR
ncbi:MAG TPA: undecaprenyl-diphosphate phosphatase [Phycisphaerales bacterium]|nr:undecaprenyl-diphosphate phosphatase [Phycisphaerales bacterium]